MSSPMNVATSIGHTGGLGTMPLPMNPAMGFQPMTLGGQNLAPQNYAQYRQWNAVQNAPQNYAPQGPGLRQ